MVSGAPGFMQILISASLLLHAIAHAIALVALTGQASLGEPAHRVSAGSWMLPGSSAQVSARVLLPLWALATIAFFGSAASSWGVLLPREIWGLLATAGALLSTSGVLATGGIWPGSPSQNRAYLNSAVAMVMNAAVLTARLWFQWIPSGWIIR